MTDIVYADTSVLVKRYLAETYSFEVRAFLAKTAPATSALTEVELIATLHAAHRARSLTQANLAAILRRLEEDRPWRYTLDISPEVISRAREVVSVQPLRSADAIHCASALILQKSSANGLAFATFDRKQRAAAAALGLKCFDLAG